MQLPALLITDLHLVDDESCSYRWGLFPWLHEQIELDRVKTLCILGDLTDSKDNHPARLVNRIFKEIEALAKKCRIIILAGNHDWRLKGHEFFKFLGGIPNVWYVDAPMEDPDLKGEPSMFLPYSKNPAKEWAGMDFSHYRYLFMHQTVKGAISSNGQEMDGEPLPELNAAKVYSGDIHVPQIIGKVEYVGSPYHVHMGDAFKPRCVLLERNGNPVDLHFKTISRVTAQVSSLRELAKTEFKAGDQVKLRIALTQAEAHDWAAVRRKAIEKLEDKGVIVHGVELVMEKADHRIGAIRQMSPEDALYEFCKAEELYGDVLEKGMELL